MGDPLPTTKKCPYCAETIQINAVVCRFCNRDLTKLPPVVKQGTAKPASEVLVIVVSLLVFACLVIAFMVGNLSTPAAPTADTGSDSMAWQMCKDFVQDRLKAPKTAEFPLPREEDGVLIARLHGQTYRVAGHVDAQNSFGAQIRTQFVCTVTYEGKGNWKLDNIVM